MELEDFIFSTFIRNESMTIVDGPKLRGLWVLIFTIKLQVY